MDQNVVSIPIKQETMRYKHHLVEIGFLPETKEWLWAFEHTQTTTYTGSADTYTKALTSSRQAVDLLVSR